jgi:hypothetical protein
MPDEIGAVRDVETPATRALPLAEASRRRAPTPTLVQSAPAAAQRQADVRLDPLRIDDSLIGRNNAARESRGTRLGATPSVAIAIPGVALGGLEVPDEQPDPNQMLLSGVVIDADTRSPIEQAVVRLDAEGALSLSVRTDATGHFSLSPKEVPTHVAVTASADGYAPEARNVSAESLRKGAQAVFLLEPDRLEVVVLEPDPQVHHLGNDEFTGSINSQFQKASEGIVYARRFMLTRDQVPPVIKRAEIRLLVKGAQTRNEIRVNGHLVERRLTGSPGDGSFGEIRARIPASWLREGRNSIEIKSVRERGTDLDDFEFVNVTIHLERARPSSAL